MTEQAQVNTDSTQKIIRPERQLAERMDELYNSSQARHNERLVPQLWQSANGGTHEDWARFYIRLFDLIKDVEGSINTGQLEEFRYNIANQMIQNCKRVVVDLPALTGAQFRSQYETRNLTALGLISPDMSEEESPLSASGWNEILEDLSTLKDTIRTSNHSR